MSNSEDRHFRAENSLISLLKVIRSSQKLGYLKQKGLNGLEVVLARTKIHKC